MLGKLIHINVHIIPTTSQVKVKIKLGFMYGFCATENFRILYLSWYISMSKVTTCISNLVSPFFAYFMQYNTIYTILVTIYHWRQLIKSLPSSPVNMPLSIVKYFLYFLPSIIKTRYMYCYSTALTKFIFLFHQADLIFQSVAQLQLYGEILGQTS